MSLGHGASIVRNGLVLHYDMGNTKKSYKGPNFENKIHKLEATNYTGEFLLSDISTEIVDIPSLGKTSVVTNNFFNDFTNSNSCCPTVFRYSENNSTQNIPLSPSTLYTYGIVYRVESGYTHPNFMYRYEYDSSGVKTTEGGVHSNSRRTHLGDNWYWAWGTFTTQPTTVKIGFAGFFYYRYSTVPDKIQCAKIFMTEGDFTSVHPKFWPEVNTSRSSTESIIDVSRTSNQISINNLSFDEDKFFFDGTDDYLSLGTQSIETLLGVSNPTEANISFIFKPYSKRNHGVFNLGSALRVGMNSNGTLGGLLFYLDGSWRNAGGASYLLDSNNIYHVSLSYNSRFVEVYINGEFISSSSFDIDWFTTSTYETNIGAYLGNPAMHGELYNMMIHNKALSAAEVKQNFEALRGRYGI